MKKFYYLVIFLFALSGMSIAEEESSVVKMEPKIREEPISSAKYRVETEYLKPYLENLLIIEDVKQAEHLPYVYKVENHILGGPGDHIFVKSLDPKDSSNIYTIIKEKQAYTHPETGEYLGTEFIIVGEAKVLDRGNITKMEILSAKYPIECGEKLIPRAGLNLPEILEGKVLEGNLQGYILNVANGIWDSGQYNNILVSLGHRDGVEIGHVLDIYRENDRKDLLPTMNKKIKKKKSSLAVKELLPASKYGEVLIYKTFDKLSLGVVVDAKYPITLLDLVRQGEKSF